MNASKHGEPWSWNEENEHEGFDLLMADGTHIVTVDYWKCEVAGVNYGHHICCGDAEADRIVACVNALAGQDPETVKRRLEERDELLAAAKSIAEVFVECISASSFGDTCEAEKMLPVLVAAVAKAEAPQ